MAIFDASCCEWAFCETLEHQRLQLAQADIDMVGGRWFESNRAYQTKSALLGGLEGLTERWALFCCLRFAKFLQKPHSKRQVPLLDPADVPINVQAAAFFPDRKCTVVEDERLAGISDNAHVVLARERHRRMPPGKEASPVLPVLPIGVSISIHTRSSPAIQLQAQC